MILCTIGHHSGWYHCKETNRGFEADDSLADHRCIVDAKGMPVQFFAPSATTADGTIAKKPIAGFEAGVLLADRGYHTEEIVNFALADGMVVVIPPKKNRKPQREYDTSLYKLRHWVENAFLHGGRNN